MHHTSEFCFVVVAVSEITYAKAEAYASDVRFDHCKDDASTPIEAALVSAVSSIAHA